MRRLSAALAGAALASSGLIMLSHAPAAFATNCGATGGTVPGTPAQTITVDASPAGIFYIDDRDYADADGDGVSQGLWTYMESNSIGGLQNGGEQVVLAMLPVPVPHADPVSIDVPTDPPTHVITLFPDGFGGGDLAQAAGEAEVCTDPGGSFDTIIN
jgi:hypothetical protein